MLHLQCDSSDAWLEAVLGDFDSFLLDHASNERKASAFALTLVSHYPDRRELVREMIQVAQEELEHFRLVYETMEERGLILKGDRRDPYVRALRQEIRNGRADFFLDRLIVGGIIEARGCERFKMIAEALPAGKLKGFYTDLYASEAKHHALFLRLARLYFDPDDVNQRLESLLATEAEIVRKLPIRSALH